MKNLILVINYIFLPLIIFSQTLTKTIEFDYTTINRIIYHKGYIYGAGYTEIPGSKKLREAFIVKMDKNGKILWQNTFGGKLFDQIKDFVIKDNKIYATGITWTKDNRSQVWFVVISDNGQIISQYDFGYKMNDGAYKILIDKDDNFYLIGFTTVLEKNTKNIWILKVDDNGKILWNKQIGNLSINEEAIDALDLDHNLFIVARVWKQGVSDYDPWLIMLSKKGDIIWQTKNNIYEDNYLVKVLKRKENFILIGETWEKNKSKKGDIWLLQINYSGQKIFDKVLGTFVVERVKDALMDNDNLWIFGGYNKNLNASIWLINNEGKIIEHKVFDLPQINSAVLLSKNQFIIGGGQGKRGYISFLNL